MSTTADIVKQNDEVLLRITDLEMNYDKKDVLHKVSFDVMRGEFLSLLGPSGCGKTTILRILIGLLKPTGGKVEKCGEDITFAHPSQRKMGIVFQNYALFENMTVLKNVEYAPLVNRDEVAAKLSREIRNLRSEQKKTCKEHSANIKKILNDANISDADKHRQVADVESAISLCRENTEAEILKLRAQLKEQKKTRKGAVRQNAIDLLKELGLGDELKKKPGELSGGQQQRVAIARTLIMRPDIILFDEPMAALDVATRLALREKIKEIQKQHNATIIYITHDQEEAFAMSDRIMVMSEGKIEQLDTPENIVNHPANDYIKDFVLKNIEIKINSLIKYHKTI